MNILRITDSFAGLFPKKISVTLIHTTEGNIVGEYKINSENLPEVFNKPTVLEIDGQSWRVTRAEPFNSDDYIKRKKLVLHVQEEERFLLHHTRSLVPTRPHPYPLTSNGHAAHDFVLSIAADDWQQIALLSVSSLPLIEAEMNQIENLISATVDDSALLGYETVHNRENIGQIALDIPFYDFYQLVNGQEKGYIQLDQHGTVTNGFFIRSLNYTYYGIVQQQRITTLCLHVFDYIDDELTNVIAAYDLVLVDWCNIRYI